MEQKTKNSFRCGFVAIIGRPNVGKSTLLNNILGQKVAIVTKIPQTTRNLIRGILTEKRGQVIFVDTPGIHLSKDRLDKYMNISASEVIVGADLVVHLVDSSENVGQEEAMVVDRLKTCKKNIILGLNKIDLGGEFVGEYIKLWEDAKRKPITELGDYITVIPLSGLKGKNIKDLLDVIFSQLPEGEALYPADMISDVPKHNMIADIIREKLMNVLRQEVPYSLAVLVEEVIERSKRLMVIKAQVFIERDSQRKIVIGQNAQLIKQSGVLARQELEKIFHKKIYLDLHVETKKDWREDPQMLQMLGYSPQ